MQLVYSYLLKYFLLTYTKHKLQLNLHETDLLFQYLSHHLTWHCSSISEDLHRFARNLQHMNAKLFLLLFLNNFKQATPRNNNKTNFLQICVNFQKYWNNAMSNDSLIIENTDLSRIQLAVCKIQHFSVDKKQQFCQT